MIVWGLRYRTDYVGDGYTRVHSSLRADVLKLAQEAATELWNKVAADRIEAKAQIKEGRDDPRTDQRYKDADLVDDSVRYALDADADDIARDSYTLYKLKTAQLCNATVVALLNGEGYETVASWVIHSKRGKLQLVSEADEAAARDKRLGVK